MVKSIKRNSRLIPLLLSIAGLILLMIGVLIAWNTLTDINGLVEDDLKLELSGKAIFQLVLILISEAILLLLFVFWIRKNTSESVSEQVNIATELELERESKDLYVNKKSDKKSENTFDHLIEKVNELNILNLSLEEYSDELLGLIAKKFEISQGILYISKLEDGNKKLIYSGGYAYFKDSKVNYDFGEGLAGQVAKAQRIVNIKNIPEGYIKIVSGLGEATPTNLLVCPITKEVEEGSEKTISTLGVLELASFKEFSKKEERFFKEFLELVTYKLDVLLN